MEYSLFQYDINGNKWTIYSHSLLFTLYYCNVNALLFLSSFLSFVYVYCTYTGFESNGLSNARLPAGSGECHPGRESCFTAECAGGSGLLSHPKPEVLITDRSDAQIHIHKLKYNLLQPNILFLKLIKQFDLSIKQNRFLLCQRHLAFSGSCLHEVWVPFWREGTHKNVHWSINI